MKQNLNPAPMQTKKKRVAIVGFEDARNRIPFSQPGWEIWGLNNFYRKMPEQRWDRWFELHKREVNLEEDGHGASHIWQLAEMTWPVYMLRHYDDIPMSLPYPLEQVTSAFRPYLTSSFSFMIAMAILEGFEEIALFGIDTADEEWGSQRPSIEYFLGYAEGKGIKVTIPGESSLLRTPFIYGYQEREEHEFIGKLLKAEQHYQGLAQRADELSRYHDLKRARAMGASEAVKALRKEWRFPFREPGALNDEEGGE